MSVAGLHAGAQAVTGTMGPGMLCAKVGNASLQDAQAVCGCHSGIVHPTASGKLTPPTPSLRERPGPRGLGSAGLRVPTTVSFALLNLLGTGCSDMGAPVSILDTVAIVDQMLVELTGGSSLRLSASGTSATGSHAVGQPALLEAQRLWQWLWTIAVREVHTHNEKVRQ